MLVVRAQTNSVVVRLHAISLAFLIAAGLASVTTSAGRSEESPAYAIEVSDVTAKVGERALMQAKLHIRDGYRILQSYNNRVIKLSAEDDGVAFEQEMVRAKIEEGVLVFAVPLRATKPGKHPVNGVFRVGYTTTRTRWPWCRFASSPVPQERNSCDRRTDAKLKTRVQGRNTLKGGRRNMQTRNDRCAPCYGRRAVLGLAFAPFIDWPSALATSRHSQTLSC